ncbi:MAG: amino acid ABC transporter substrate-binding protein [Acutalibacter sp.]|nr:amino acid ABC transporter substrate-binding protein [Acutalibacter sp.]
MKKIFACLLAAALMLSLTACGGGSSEDAKYNTVESGKLIMSTNAEFPPYEMQADGEGVYTGADSVKFEGIDVEIALALAEKLGLELVIDDMDFDAALIAVQQGKSDMVLAGLTYREDRDELMDFSTSYATGVQVVIVRDDSDITDLDDLENDKMIGTQRGTTGYIYASDTPENGGYGEDHVLAYDNGALAVQALLNGQIDAVIIDNAPAQAYVASNDGLHILPAEWVTEDYCLAVNEGNTELLDALNSALEKLINDGTVQIILDKYITE